MISFGEKKHTLQNTNISSFVVCWKCNVAAMFQGNQCLVDGTETPENCSLIKLAVFWPTFDQLHNLRVNGFRFGVAVPPESEGADHCGGIPLIIRGHVEVCGFVASAPPSISVST